MVRPDTPNAQNGDPQVHDEEDVYEHLPPPPPSPPPPPPPVDGTYEQHQPPPAQQGYGIPMQQQATTPVVFHIHNTINGVPNNGYGQQDPPPPQQMAPLPQYQPPPQPPPQPRYPQAWKTGLFDCLEDPENAIITLVCPCVTFGQLAAAIDNGTSCELSGCIYTLVALIIGMPCIISCTYRSKLRGRFGLVEEPLTDCMTHLCCEYCALCQEYRELNHRGFNPSAGWMRIGNNQNMQQHQQSMNPPPGQWMG